MSGEEYPWLEIDLGRPHRVTTVWLVTGNETVTNLDVRVGNASFDDPFGTMMNTNNTRYFGNSNSRAFYYFNLF